MNIFVSLGELFLFNYYYCWGWEWRASPPVPYPQLGEFKACHTLFPWVLYNLLRDLWYTFISGSFFSCLRFQPSLVIVSSPAESTHPQQSGTISRWENKIMKSLPTAIARFHPSKCHLFHLQSNKCLVTRI